MNLLFPEYELKNSDKNKLDRSDRQFHGWYRFVLSYPPHIVRQYIQEFGLSQEDILLDPFCGTGTTVVEAKLRGIPSIGVEANAFPYFASSTKTSWNIDVILLRQAAEQVRAKTLQLLASQGISDEASSENQKAKNLRGLSEEQEKLILTDSISPLPLHKSLVLLDAIDDFRGSSVHDYLRLAFGNILVYEISNLRFGPEVGVGKRKEDVAVIAPWFVKLKKMCSDLEAVMGRDYPEAVIFHSDSRNLKELLHGRQVACVITSPPYPNEKDYTRTTRLESVILGFVNTKGDLRSLKKSLLRSNTRGIYKGDDDDEYVKGFPEIQRISKEIEDRRIEMGKTSGFEKLYHKVTKLYFGGMAKHLLELQSVLKPGAHLAYVVGDQASYLRVMIRTGHLLAEIAQSLGYELIRIDLFRTRFSTATKTDLNEEVVILRWPG